MALLFRLWLQPSAAMSEILDRGSLLFASIAVLVVTAIFKTNAPWLAAGFFMPLLLLAAVYVPGLLLLVTLLGRLGSLGIVFRRDYSPLLTCAGMGLAAAAIPLSAASFLFPPMLVLYMTVPAMLYFALLMFFAVRAVFGVENGVA